MEKAAGELSQAARARACLDKRSRQGSWCIGVDIPVGPVIPERMCYGKSMTQNCAECSAAATHTLTVTTPGDEPVVNVVCRQHDRTEKIDIPKSRLPYLLAMRQDSGGTAEKTVSCAECLLPLDDRGVPAADREPCLV